MAVEDSLQREVHAGLDGLCDTDGRGSGLQLIGQHRDSFAVFVGDDQVRIAVHVEIASGDREPQRAGTFIEHPGRFWGQELSRAIVSQQADIGRDSLTGARLMRHCEVQVAVLFEIDGYDRRRPDIGRE